MPLAAIVLTGLCFTSGLFGQETFEGRTLDEWSVTLTSSQGKERQVAARGIAELAGRQTNEFQVAESYSQLVQLLSDNDAVVRYWGVRGIAWFADKLSPGDGGRQAAVTTLAPLLEDREPAPRIAAAQTLVRLGGEGQPLAVLITALTDRDESVRVLGASAMEALGAAAAPAKMAIRKAASDNSPAVQQIARRILRRLEDSQP
jgi:HEAT repeat protein